MNAYNLIFVLSLQRDSVLMCLRTTQPYQNKYNLIGGKHEKNESAIEAAYRELKEETGISTNDIQLLHIMDYYYYDDQLKIEVFAGVINNEVSLVPEKHPLNWIKLDSDFLDKSTFAGEGNLPHIIEIALRNLNRI